MQLMNYYLLPALRKTITSTANSKFTKDMLGAEIKFSE